MLSHISELRHALLKVTSLAKAQSRAISCIAATIVTWFKCFYIFSSLSLTVIFQCYALEKTLLSNPSIIMSHSLTSILILLSSLLDILNMDASREVSHQLLYAFLVYSFKATCTVCYKKLFDVITLTNVSFQSMPDLYQWWCIKFIHLLSLLSNRLV